MKKIVILIFVILLINSFIFSNFVYAQVSTDQLEDTIGNLEEKKETIEDLSAEDIKAQYLKKEWGKILEKNKFFSPFIHLGENISPVTDPVFKYTVGLSPSLTWLFVLTFVLWITFLIYLYRALSGFSTFSDTTSLVISFALIIATGNLGLWKSVSEKIINIIMIFTIWWVQLIIAGVFIIGLIIANVFSKQFKLFIMAWKAKKEKEKEKENRKDFERAKNTAVKFSKTITKALGRGEK